MKRTSRALALLMGVFLALVLLASSAYLAHEAQHDCVGEGCEICENIARMGALLRSFALLWGVFSLLFALPLLLSRSGQRARRAYAALTPVSWKVRLNN